MSVDRLDRINSLLRRVIADAIFRVFQADDFDPGRITVTGVTCAKNLRNATVRVSVFGPEAERQVAVHHLIHHAREFQALINRDLKLKFTPQLRFVLDESLEKGDRVLTVLDRMSRGEELPAPDGPADAGMPPHRRGGEAPVFTPLDS